MFKTFTALNKLLKITSDYALPLVENIPTTTKIDKLEHELEDYKILNHLNDAMMKVYFEEVLRLRKELPFSDQLESMRRVDLAMTDIRI